MWNAWRLHIGHWIISTDEHVPSTPNAENIYVYLYLFRFDLYIFAVDWLHARVRYCVECLCALAWNMGISEHEYWNNVCGFRMERGQWFSSKWTEMEILKWELLQNNRTLNRRSTTKLYVVFVNMLFCTFYAHRICEMVGFTLESSTLQAFWTPAHKLLKSIFRLHLPCCDCLLSLPARKIKLHSTGCDDCVCGRIKFYHCRIRVRADVRCSLINFIERSFAKTKILECNRRTQWNALVFIVDDDGSLDSYKIL